jgi:hypothetical protein
LETITAAYTGTDSINAELQRWINPYLTLFYPGRAPFVEVVQGKVKLFHIWKAAPGMLKDAIFGKSNYSSHPYNVLRALLSLRARPGLWSAFNIVITILNNKPLLKMVNIIEEYQLWAMPVTAAVGKLHAKEEAAGKVRLFAMADAPTQWALYPLHSALLDQLKTIDQDGTFDQTRPLSFLDGSQGLYSYDLTAATDRLPLSLQKLLLTGLIGQGFSDAWAELLVGRTYGFRQLGYEKWHGNYKYAVGQPMGAYSSWAMLAVTHHFLVQASAWRAGVVPCGVWFTNYAVLGDDIVIGNRAVAQAYLVLLKELGMPVNLHKSLVSDKGTCLEFAKRTLYKGTDISPVPLKELGAAQGLATAMVGFGIKYALSFPQLLQAFGYGFRAISWLSKPLYKLSASIRTLLLVSRMPKSAAELASFFSFGYKDAKFVHLDVLGTALKESVLAKYQPRYQAEWSTIEWDIDANHYEILGDDPKTSTILVYDLVTEQVQGWYSSLYYLYESSLSAKMPADGIEELDWELARQLAKEGKTIAAIDAVLGTAKLTAEGITFMKSMLPKGYESGLTYLFSVLWDEVYGPGVARYKETILTALQDFEQRYSEEYSEAIWEDEDITVSYDFFKRYWDLLQTLEEVSKVSPQTLEFERPEGMEGVALDYNAVTPIQVRYYRAWSGVLTGCQDLLRARVVKSALPAGVVPSATKEVTPEVAAFSWD